MKYFSVFLFFIEIPKLIAEQKKPTLINRRLYYELFINQCDVSLTFSHNSEVSIRALRNPFHQLKCNSFSSLAKYILKINPKRIKLIVDGQNKQLFQELSVFCNAILELDRLQFIQVYINTWTYDEENHIIFEDSNRKLLECMPDKITDFSSISVKSAWQFKKRKILDNFYIPSVGILANKDMPKLEFAVLLQVKAKHIHIDNTYNLLSMNFDEQPPIRPNRNLETLTVYANIAPKYTLVDQNKSLEIDEDEIRKQVNVLASLSVLCADHKFLIVVTDEIKIIVIDGENTQPEDITDLLGHLLNKTNLLLESLNKLGVKLKAFHLKPTIDLSEKLINDKNWMSDLIDRLIVDFHIKKYATDCDEYFQLQGWIQHSSGQQIIITLTISSKNEVPRIERNRSSNSPIVVAKLVDLIQQKIVSSEKNKF